MEWLRTAVHRAKAAGEGRREYQFMESIPLRPTTASRFLQQEGPGRNELQILES
jgi:hypothetical protein